MTSFICLPNEVLVKILTLCAINLPRHNIGPHGKIPTGLLLVCQKFNTLGTSIFRSNTMSFNLDCCKILPLDSWLGIFRRPVLPLNLHLTLITPRPETRDCLWKLCAALSSRKLLSCHLEVPENAAWDDTTLADLGALCLLDCQSLSFSDNIAVKIPPVISRTAHSGNDGCPDRQHWMPDLEKLYNEAGILTDNVVAWEQLWNQRRSIIAAASHLCNKVIRPGLVVRLQPDNKRISSGTTLLERVERLTCTVKVDHSPKSVTHDLKIVNGRERSCNGHKHQMKKSRLKVDVLGPPLTRHLYKLRLSIQICCEQWCKTQIGFKVECGCDSFRLGPRRRKCRLGLPREQSSSRDLSNIGVLGKETLIALESNILPFTRLGRIKLAVHWQDWRAPALTLQIPQHIHRRTLEASVFSSLAMTRNEHSNGQLKVLKEEINRLLTRSWNDLSALNHSYFNVDFDMNVALISCELNQQSHQAILPPGQALECSFFRPDPCTFQLSKPELVGRLKFRPQAGRLFNFHNADNRKDWNAYVLHTPTHSKQRDEWDLTLPGQTSSLKKILGLQCGARFTQEFARRHGFVAFVMLHFVQPQKYLLMDLTIIQAVTVEQNRPLFFPGWMIAQD